MAKTTKKKTVKKASTKKVVKKAVKKTAKKKVVRKTAKKVAKTSVRRSSVKKVKKTKLRKSRTVKKVARKVHTVKSLKDEVINEDGIIDYEESGEDVEYVYDQITGGRMKKPVMAVLNKTKLSKYEMDDLFNAWD